MTLATVVLACSLRRNCIKVRSLRFKIGTLEHLILAETMLGSWIWRKVENFHFIGHTMSKTTIPGYDFATVNGIPVSPRNYLLLYHGTADVSLDAFKQNEGLPAKGVDIELVRHVEDNQGVTGRSAFRGTTLLQSFPPDDDNAHGAVRVDWYIRSVISLAMMSTYCWMDGFLMAWAGFVARSIRNRKLRFLRGSGLRMFSGLGWSSKNAAAYVLNGLGIVLGAMHETIIISTDNVPRCGGN